jgi:beta-N-acetylhexosaminidase
VIHRPRTGRLPEASPKYAMALSLVACMVASLAAFAGACAGQTPVTVQTSMSAPTSVTTAPSTATCTSESTSSTTTTLMPTTSSTSTSSATPALSPRQIAGQRVIYSYPGLTPPAALISVISHGEAAGVIFFAENISSGEQIRGVIKKLAEAAAGPENPVRAPLLLMIDQEGGKTRRLPGEPLLSEKQIGRSADPAEEATEAGTGAGLNLRGVGMNVNLAPVLDVYRKAGGFDDQYERSYSTDPDVVSELGAGFILAQQETGVAATAKHFPGLGAATRSQNTDLRPVTLDVSAKSLTTIDEYPYEAAIGAGVRLVMVSWAIYPALDKGMPAGLSPAIVQGELRGRLHFQGVTVTDALEAGALEAFGTIRDRAVFAAAAGMDLILCSSRQVSDGQQAREGLESGYLDGTLSKSAFLASVRRIIDLRSSLRD